MPQVSRATRGMSSISVGTLNSLIATLKSNIAVGAGITASDVNQLISAYNTWQQHRHKADDLRGVDTYGNVNFYGGGTYVSPDPESTQAQDTGGNGYPNEGFLNAIGDTIDDTDVNTIIARINSIRSHKHVIFDTTS